VDATGNVYVADYYNNRIRKVTPAGVVTTVAGSGSLAFADGTGSTASFFYPAGAAVDAAGSIYIGDSANNRIRKVTPAGVVTTLAGSSSKVFADGTGSAATFNAPHGLAVDADGNVYIADASNNRIRKMTPAGVVTTLTGSGSPAFADGLESEASFNFPLGVAVDSAGNVYVADYSNNRVRKVTPAGLVTTLAGSGSPTFADGTGIAASFQGPSGVAVDTTGNVYVADEWNGRIRRVTPAGVVTTLAVINEPYGIALDGAGVIYVGDYGDDRISKVTPLGAGDLAVTWSAPSTAGSSAITGYTASASAPNQATQTCVTAGATTCTIHGLTSGVAYSVSVTATNMVGTSAPSSPASATPN
jgi:sugar lactone lactonase YvrE